MKKVLRSVLAGMLMLGMAGCTAGGGSKGGKDSNSSVDPAIPPDAFVDPVTDSVSFNIAGSYQGTIDNFLMTAFITQEQDKATGTFIININGVEVSGKFTVGVIEEEVTGRFEPTSNPTSCDFRVDLVFRLADSHLVGTYTPLDCSITTSGTIDLTRVDSITPPSTTPAPVDFGTIAGNYTGTANGVKFDLTLTDATPSGFQPGVFF